MEIGLYQCDKCHKETEIDGIAYLGPKNRPDDKCGPFQDFECICLNCEKTNNGWTSSNEWTG